MFLSLRYFVIYENYIPMCFPTQLCFLKGDLITVTQREDGGWWEGTLADKTGWFPSNYVREYKPQGKCQENYCLFSTLCHCTASLTVLPLEYFMCLLIISKKYTIVKFNASSFSDHVVTYFTH